MVATPFLKRRQQVLKPRDSPDIPMSVKGQEANLLDLLDRIRSGRYIAPPVRRTYIPKADGSRRPVRAEVFARWTNPVPANAAAPTNRFDLAKLVGAASPRLFWLRNVQEVGRRLRYQHN
jgi:hypothetical protein